MKNYVYKVNRTGEICGDLNTAIYQATNSIKAEHKVVSKPIITKIWGGYLVTCVGYDGKIFKRAIDVFVPTMLNSPKYKIDKSGLGLYISKDRTTEEYTRIQNIIQNKQKIIGYCNYCGEAIYDRQNHYSTINGTLYCDKKCYNDYVDNITDNNCYDDNDDDNDDDDFVDCDEY